MNDLKVKQTTDYSKFKTILGNRDINKAHKHRIRKSIEDNGLLAKFIIVNEKMEIIDGQHRFEVLSEMELPINYIVVEGYKLAQVHVYNQNSKNCSMDQFMESYVGMGLRDYQIYKFYKEKYNFGHNECLSFLAGKYTSGQNLTNPFRKGLFKVKALEEAKKIGDAVLDFAPYYSGFKRRSFVFAIGKLIKTKGYNHAIMIEKIKYQSAKLTDQTNSTEYLKVLEKIYNYKSRSDYVRFDLVVNG